MAPRGSAPTRPLDLAVVGHANVDRIVEVPRLPEPERTVPVLSVRRALGGTAVTLARSAAARGLSVGLVTRIGPDFPPAFLAVLRQEGVDLVGVERMPGIPSSSCWIFEDGAGHQSTVIDQGPMGDRWGPTRRAGEQVARAPWAHLGTGAPRYLAGLRDAARRRGVRVAVDPAQEIHYRWRSRPFRRLIGGAEILFGNEGEVSAARRLARAGSVSGLLASVSMVVVTRGAKGARAYTRAGAVSVPATRVRGRLRQVTGAGDAFRGGFYAAYLKGRPLRAALVAGTKSASAWMRSGGPPGRRRGAGAVALEGSG